VLGERAASPVDDAGRPGGIIQMLKLTPAAFGEMAAWRMLMIGPSNDGAVGLHAVAGRGKRHMAAIRRHAVAARRHANDFVVFAHRHSAMARGIASINRSAQKAGPESCAARP